MNISKVKSDWIKYNDEFDNSEEMDIEKHINMAMNVGALLNEVKRLSYEVERLSDIIDLHDLPLHPCDDCNKREKNPGLDVCGECYHKRIWGDE